MRHAYIPDCYIKNNQVHIRLFSLHFYLTLCADCLHLNVIRVHQTAIIHNRRSIQRYADTTNRLFISSCHFITCKYNNCFITQVESSENFTFFPPPVTDFGLIWNMAEDKIVPTPLSSFLQTFGLKSLKYYS